MFYSNPEDSPELRRKIEEVMGSFGFSWYSAKPGTPPGYFREPLSGIMIRYKSLKRWYYESADFEKRIRDEIGRLIIESD